MSFTSFKISLFAHLFLIYIQNQKKKNPKKIGDKQKGNSNSLNSRHDLWALK